MKTMMTAVAVTLTFANGFAQEMPKPQKEHEWMQQLVGEWDVEGEAIVEAGKPPVKTKSTESVRAVGGYWILSEIKGETVGVPFSGVFTLGFSPEKKKYVGTWVDSMGSHLWTYQGSVDATGKILTLESEGPSYDQPGKLAKYRDVLEIKEKDQKLLTSSVEKDGKWITYVTLQYRRKK